MSLDPQVEEQIRSLIGQDEVVLFMKGNRFQPQCGFSATVVRILDSLISDYQTVDVLSDGGIREGIKLFSSWPTIPQLYVKGEFVGGCDIVQEMLATGELFAALGLPPVEAITPEITITPAAADALQSAAAEHAGPGRSLHLSIDASFQPNLTIAPDVPGEIQVESGGITLALDRLSAGRANGLSIDMVETPEGRGFKIDNPNAPSVQPMSVQELAATLGRGDPIQLFDVRTPEERAMASIPGALLLTQDEAERIERLPRDTVLVFHCHHGGRSQQAAEHFAGKGFGRVFNVIGGIDAWSQHVDPSVPRY